MWEAATGDVHQMLEGHASDAWCVAFDPTGSLLATGDSKGTTIVWDVAAGKRLKGFHEENDPVYAVAFLAKGSRLIIGRHSGQIRIRDVESGKTIREAKVLEDLSALAVAPHARHLAVVNDGHNVQLFIDGYPARRDPVHVDAAGISSANRGWTIGSASYDHAPQIFGGCIGEVRVVSYALPSDEFLISRPIAR